MVWPIDRRFRGDTTYDDARPRVSGGEFEARLDSLTQRFTTATGLAETWGLSALFHRVTQPVYSFSQRLFFRAMPSSPVAAFGLISLAVAGLSASLMTLYSRYRSEGEQEPLGRQWIVSALYSIPQTLLFAGVLTRLPLRGSLAQFVVREPLQALVAVATQRSMAAAGLVERAAMGLFQQVAIETAEGGAQGAASSIRVRGIVPRSFGLSMLVGDVAPDPVTISARRLQIIRELAENKAAKPEVRAEAEKILQEGKGGPPPAGNGGSGKGGNGKPKSVRPPWLSNRWDLGEHLRHDLATGRYSLEVPEGWRGRFEGIDFARRLDELRWPTGETREEYLRRFGLNLNSFMGLTQVKRSIPGPVEDLEKMAYALAMTPSVLILGCRPDLARHCDLIYVKSPLKPDLPPSGPLPFMQDLFSAHDLRSLAPPVKTASQAKSLFVRAWDLFWKRTPLSLHPTVRQQLGITLENISDVRSGKSPLPAAAVPALSRFWGLPSGSLYLLSQSTWLPTGVAADIAGGTVRIQTCGFSRGNICGLSERVPQDLMRMVGRLIASCSSHEIYGLRRSTWGKLCQGRFEPRHYRRSRRVMSAVEKLLGRPGHLWYSVNRETLRSCQVRVVFEGSLEDLLRQGRDRRSKVRLSAIQALGRVAQADPSRRPKILSSLKDHPAGRHREVIDAIRTGRPILANGEMPAETLEQLVERTLQVHRGRRTFVLPVEWRERLGERKLLVALLDERRWETGETRDEFLRPHRWTFRNFDEMARGAQMVTPERIEQVARILGVPVGVVLLSLHPELGRRHGVAFVPASGPARRIRPHFMEEAISAICWKGLDRGRARSHFVRLWGLFWDGTPKKMKPGLQRGFAFRHKSFRRDITSERSQLSEEVAPFLAETWGLDTARAYLLSQSGFIPREARIDYSGRRIWLRGEACRVWYSTRKGMLRRYGISVFL